MMEGVIERGTAKKLKDLDIPIAGKQVLQIKTNAIGFTPDMVIVYMLVMINQVFRIQANWFKRAVPIFKNFANKIQINKNKKPFRIPSGISFVRIDPNSGTISNNRDSIIEPFILGSEPYSGNINLLMV